MPPRKTAKDFFRRGRERGSADCQKGIDNSVIFKKLSPKTEGDYNRMLGLWKEFAEAHAEDNPDPYDVKSLKEFMKEVAFSIEGAGDDPNPAKETVKVYWKQFTGGWRRQSVPIPRHITYPVTMFIKHELPDILKEESSIRMVDAKRTRRFGTKNHFIHLGRQLWGNDWFKYEKPGTRVYVWACLMAIVCSSARIGEYIESSCRPDSDRGLYYKDVTFAVFRNELGDAEFAVQLVRDAKNMKDEPHKRPKHALYENFVPMPLICNAMLPILAIAIADRAFRDIDTIEDLLALEPEEGEMLHLPWKECILDRPFFKSMSSRRGEGKIETAGTLSKRLHDLGVRAGYMRPPTVHDFRAEGLYWIDLLYSAAQRMKHAGHKNAQTYGNHYQPNNCGTDGQGSYFGLDVRTIVNDLFRGTTVERNPDLSQRLPAEKEEALAKSAEVVAIRTELAALRGQRDDKAAKRRIKLYQDRKKLADKELSRWQRNQPNSRLKTGKDSTPCYDRGIFNRVKFLMPERDRLASILFETHTLRSPTGLEALRYMVALCEADAEVTVRPGLEPSKCRCAGSTRRRKIPGSSEFSMRQDTRDWKHVYRCFKNAHDDFIEFCFLCSAWVYGKKEWTEHCSHHLACPDELPAQCDPLLYGGVLATAGYCMFCMANASLPPEARLCQFLDKRTWQKHVHNHYNEHVQTIGDDKLVKCPHPGMCCDAGFDSVDQFKFHVLDCHCRDLIKAPSTWEPSSHAEDVEFTPSSKRERMTVETDAKGANDEADCCFVDETVDLVRHYGSEYASMTPQPVREDPFSPYSGIGFDGVSSYPSP